MALESQALHLGVKKGAAAICCVPQPQGPGDAAALACSPEPLLCATRGQKGLFLSERQLQDLLQLRLLLPETELLLLQLFGRELHGQLQVAIKTVQPT